ncbi:MAG: PAS-domain containing protein [Ferrovibrionaceae bacterium]
MAARDDTTEADLLRVALDHIDQGISIFDDDLRLIGWNRRFLELLQLPRAVVRHGVDFAELLRFMARRGDYGHVDVEELVRVRVAAARARTRFYSERASLDQQVLATQTTPLASGGFVTVYTDISERSAAEMLTPARNDELEARANQRTIELRGLNEELHRKVRELQETSGALQISRERLRLITDVIPAAIAHVDQDLRLTFANRRFSQILGQQVQNQQPPAIVGSTLGQLFPGEAYHGLLDRVAAALDGTPDTFDFTYRSALGEDIVTHNTLIPEIADDRTVQGIFLLSLDVTEEKRAEAALREAQKMSAIGQLAGGLAHDFNNLLTVIVGNLASLREQVGAEVFQEFVEPAIRAGHRGADITRRLLAFARQQSLDPVAIDVPSLVAGVAQLLRRSLPGTITIHCADEAGGWPAHADPHQLENALVNLAINARDAMPDGGVLSFKTEYLTAPQGDQWAEVPPGDYVSLSVVDTGHGMDEATMAHALEPFFTTKPFGGGSGLGLSIVYGFVQQSRGHFRLRSEPGKGTAISLLLPRSTELPVAEPAADADAAFNSGGALVLLVEDNEEVRRVARRQLLELGYQVLEASDALEGQALIDSIPEITLLVSDIMMPGRLDGLGLARYARGQRPELRVVLVSGYADTATLTADEERDWPVLRKPFVREQLARSILGAA